MAMCTPPISLRYLRGMHAREAHVTGHNIMQEGGHTVTQHKRDYHQSKLSGYTQDCFTCACQADTASLHEGAKLLMLTSCTVGALRVAA